MGDRRCFLCHGGDLRTWRTSARLTVERCVACDHRTAEHAAHSDPDQLGDYHEQYAQDGFLDSLEVTRRRQARRITAWLRAELPGATRLLDFGAGRAWFLDGAGAGGFTQLMGADFSERSLEGLRDRGIAGFRTSLRPSENWPELPFRPQVVSFLDVLEHFQLPEAVNLVRNAVRQGDAGVHVLIKVPLADGFLYRAAAAAARVGQPGMLEQLYQVGTEPPHLSYFSRRSLDHLLGRCGLVRVSALFDLDFEPENLPERAQLGLLGMARWSAGVAASVLAWFIEWTGMQDTEIVLARPAAGL
jgi:hypothetical protein